MQLFTIFAMIFTAGGVMFAFQNNVPVTVNFFVWRFDSSLAMVMLFALAAGGIIMALVSNTVHPETAVGLESTAEAGRHAREGMQCARDRLAGSPRGA